MINPKFRYALLQLNEQIECVEFPDSYMYQLTALNQRLHKEISKLTASNVPKLPHVIAECAEIELIDKQVPLINGLTYMNQLESSFAHIDEKSYPLISLLTEIRALQAQLEQWYEEEFEE